MDKLNLSWKEYLAIGLAGSLVILSFRTNNPREALYKCLDVFCMSGFRDKVFGPNLLSID